MGASLLAQSTLRNKFARYSKIPLANGMSGEQIARQMLADYGVQGVRVTSVEGELSDNYNPTDRTVNLSRDVFYGRNAAAAAVAAHECGHAVQHAKAYSFLKFRSAMVPVLSVTNRLLPLILFGGALLLQATPIPLMFGVALFALTTLFAFLTLPVEFDASRRALAWMGERGVVTQQELGMSKDALWWAASTYVIGALSSPCIFVLLYFTFEQSSRLSRKTSQFVCTTPVHLSNLRGFCFFPRQHYSRRRVRYI